LPHVFPTEEPTELLPLRKLSEIMQHKIEVVEGAEWHLHYIPSYDRFQDPITEKINKKFETGRIILAKSRNPIIIFTQLKKHGKKARFLLNCIPRKFKRHKVRMPILRIKQIIDCLARKKFKSKLDLTDGYHKIRHHLDSIKHSTFSFDMEKFDSLVIQQSDCNTPATMIRAINWLLREFLGKTVMVYLNDILIGNNIYEEHVQRVRAGLKTLERAKLWFNKVKCQIMPKRIELLVHVLHNNGLEADPGKIKKVLDFKTPTNRKDIQTFMGVANYFARFCKDLVTKGRCLYELQVSTKQFKWTHLHDEAFKQVKVLIMCNSVLKPINHKSNEQIYLITDTSNVGLSGWIGQEEDSIIRPAAFHSKCLNKGQTNYTPTYKELLAIVDLLRHFRSELQGHKVIVLTDHKPLVTFMTTWQDKQMKIRLQQVMSEFGMTLQYIEEKENFIADTPSRAGVYKGSASPSSSDLSSLPNHTPTLPPLVVVNHIFISHPYLLPPSTNTNYSNSMPTRRTIREMPVEPVYPPSSTTRHYYSPQSPYSASSSSSTGLGYIFQQERHRRHQELQ